MPLDPRVRRFLDVLAATQPPSVLSQSAGERRAGLEQLMRFSGPPEAVTAVDERTVAGAEAPLPARLYTPLATRAPTLPGLVYFHGGGLVAGSIATHDGIARALANAGACQVVSVDYRLAPEHRFPAAVDDAIAAVRDVAARAVEFDIDPSRLAVAGDSAGATLAAVACQAVARAGGPPLALQLLICPIMDFGGTTESRRELARGFLLDEATLEHDLVHYLPPGADLADPRISPLRAPELHGLPRTSIHTAEFDPLRDEGKAYADRLERAGTPVSYTCHPGMIHLFYGMAAVIPYAREAFAGIGAEIRAALS